jgi:hypothetical protein
MAVSIEWAAKHTERGNNICSSGAYAAAAAALTFDPGSCAKIAHHRICSSQVRSKLT